MTQNKNYLKKGFSSFLYALPLLVAGPVVTTIGFKAIKREDNYLFFIIGFILSITAMIFLTIAVKRILQHLFDK